MARIVKPLLVAVGMTKEEADIARKMDGVLSISEPNEEGVRRMWYDNNLIDARGIIDNVNIEMITKETRHG